MGSVTSVSLSGMHAASLRLGVAAHNVANAATDGFQRQRAALQEAPGGGVTARVETLPTPGAALADDLVATLAATHAFAANLRVFQAHDAMAGSLLSIRA
jgi:flagellar hook protein FlgE